MGRHEDKDLYVHVDNDEPLMTTVISRWSSDGDDYSSGLKFASDGDLRVAAERAREKGLITEEVWSYYEEKQWKRFTNN